MEFEIKIDPYAKWNGIPENQTNIAGYFFNEKTNRPELKRIHINEFIDCKPVKLGNSIYGSFPKEIIDKIYNVTSFAENDEIIFFYYKPSKEESLLNPLPEYWECIPSNRNNYYFDFHAFLYDHKEFTPIVGWKNYKKIRNRVEKWLNRENAIVLKSYEEYKEEPIKEKLNLKFTDDFEEIKKMIANKKERQGSLF